MNPYVILGALVALAAAGGGGYFAGWQARGWKADSDAAAIVEATHRAVAAQAQRADTAAEAYETKRTARAVQTQYIDREVIRVVQSPLYAAQCVDPDGMRLIAAALAGSAPDPGQPAPAVPDSAASR